MDALEVIFHLERAHLREACLTWRASQRRMVVTMVGVGEGSGCRRTIGAFRAWGADPGSQQS